MNDFTKTIQYWPIEQLRVLTLFIEKGDGGVKYPDMLRRLGINPDKMPPKTGKSVGGILSSLRRNKIQNEPLIIPLGRVLGTRQMHWRLNSKIFTQEIKDQVLQAIAAILKERGIS